MDLQASFAPNVTIGNAPLDVSFTNTSQGPFIRVEWDFGDGSKSTQFNPTHTYNTDGSYTVSLTIFDDGGTSTVATRTITVLSQQFADTAGAVNQQALFTYKRFEPGQVAVRRVTTSASVWKTDLITDLGAGGDAQINPDIQTVILDTSSFTGGNTIGYTNTPSVEAELNAATESYIAVTRSITGATGGDVKTFNGSYGDRFTPTSPAESPPLLVYKIVSYDTVNEVLTVDRQLPNVLDDGTGQHSARLISLCGDTQWFGENVDEHISVGMKLGVDSAEQMFFPGIDFDTFDEARKIRGFAAYAGYTGSSGATYAVMYPWISGASTANRFYPGSVYLYIPWLMWHKAQIPGLEMWDYADPTQRDPETGLRFRYLRDGKTQNDTIIGQVFHDKNLVLITDPEIAATLQWNNDRSWTLPAPTIKHVSADDEWVSGGTSNAAPTGVSWYWTYRVVERDPSDGSWPTTKLGGDYLGYTEELAGLPCQYVQRVDIPSGETGLGYFTMTIPKLNQATGGTNCVVNDIQGFVASWVEILAATGATGAPGPDMDSWRIMTGVPADAAWTGNFGTDVTFNIDNNSSFRYDISGETYSWDTTNMSGSSDLELGGEPFALAFMSGNYASDIYKMSAVCVGRNNEFNNTQNLTYDEASDEYVYITEVGLYNEANELLMVGKLSNPIKKNDQKFVTVKLELDL